VATECSIVATIRQNPASVSWARIARCPSMRVHDPARQDASLERSLAWGFSLDTSDSMKPKEPPRRGVHLVDAVDP
jgi:hypothetical protein